MSDQTGQDEQKTERFNMFMSPSEMKAIDDWAWENKIRSKSEAVRRLIQMGLHADRNFETVKTQTDGTMEYMVNRIQKYAKMANTAKNDGGTPPTIADYSEMIKDIVSMVAHLAGTVSATASSLSILKERGEVPDLIEHTKAFEKIMSNSVDRASALISEMGKKE